MKRQHYIDNLRWICILILIPFHTAMAWNSWESNYIWFGVNKALSSFVIFICPFYMPILFVLAGMSMNFALRKRTYSQFIMERVTKLFIPLLSGILTVVALMTYMADRYNNSYSGNFIKHYSVFLGSLGDFTGYDGKFTPAHLWFLLFLFIASLLVLLFVKIQRKFFLNFSCKNMKMWQVFLLVIFPILFSLILDFGGKSIGESFALVMLGYYVFSEEDITRKLEKYSIVFLTITFAACCALVFIFVWQGNHEALICNVLQEIAKWCGVLGFIGFGKKYLEHDNKITRFLTARSFAIYIFHFGWIVLIQFYLSKLIMNTALLYIGTVVGSFVMTLLMVEMVKNIPVIRLLFGFKKKKKILE